MPPSFLRGGATERCATLISAASKRFRAPGSAGITWVMLAAVRSAALVGIDAYDVIVEVDAAQGLPQWTIVGLAASAVKESRDRVGAGGDAELHVRVLDGDDCPGP